MHRYTKTLGDYEIVEVFRLQVLQRTAFKDLKLILYRSYNLYKVYSISGFLATLTLTACKVSKQSDHDKNGIFI